MSIQDVLPTVGAVSTMVESLLASGKSIQSKADIGDINAQLATLFPTINTSESRRKIQWPVVEKACRDTYNRLVATTNIEDKAFAQLWDLFDIISILSDEGQCDPPLLLWLAEELLDSQTIAGCRIVFDYLESRREKITAKNFDTKELVILRTCNELLRRLSRADDTAFCGRVYIFMFQSFPLGNKSSVNLRGEFHTENVTTWDQQEKAADVMEVDSGTPKIEITKDGERKTPSASDTPAKGVSLSKKQEPISLDELYPKFWSLQNYFSQPKRLFESESLSAFKVGLEATIAQFQAYPSTKKTMDDREGGQQNRLKRKRGNTSAPFNPRYLTRRDLFDLEIRDLTFQRNVMLQALIVIEYMLSLSPKSKEKLTNSLVDKPKPNMSVMYADLKLSEEDTEWARKTKGVIGDFIKSDHEGKLYYRMIETVIARDKNWAWWKIRNCPPISIPAVSPETFVIAKGIAKKGATNKRLRPHPLNSLDLGFLKDNHGGLERLKNPERYELPSVKSFQEKIDLDDMDIDMAASDETKQYAMEAKASKSWRALRIAGADNLVAFDKIEKPDKIDIIFKDKTDAAHIDDEEEDTKQPKDRRPIVVSGPSGVGKGTLVSMLVGKHPKVFAKKASHTTRKPREGEVHGTHYYFVTKEEYNVIRDSDEFLEYNNFNGNDYGTSRKVVQGIISQGKVPIMEMDYHGIQQVKDNDYSARFIFLAPPNEAELEQRLTKRETDTSEKIKERLEIAKEEIKQSEIEGFHDKIFINDDLDATFQEFEAYIFGDEEADAAENGASLTEDADAADRTTTGEETTTSAMEVEATK